MLIHETTAELVAALRAPAASPRATVTPLPRPSPANGVRVAVPVGASFSGPTETLAAALRRRRSVRQFSAAPLALTDLTALLDTAIAYDRTQWPSEAAAGRDLEWLLLATRVDGLPVGAWWREAADSALHRAGGMRDDPAEMFLQAEFASAPLVLTAIGPAAAMVAAHGVKAYRALLARGSGALYAAWLEGVRHGLDGCLFAGILGNALRVQFAVDGVVRMPLIALAIGHAATSTGAR